MTENKEISVRCPRCNGRLFDIVYSEKQITLQKSSYMIVVKCWKCRRKLNIENRNLVQAPRMQEYGVGV